MTDYQKLALRTESKPTPEMKERVLANLRLQHAVWGLATEAIELKGHVDDINLAEECGDLEWYLALIRDSLGLGEHFVESEEEAMPEFSEIYETKEDCVKRIVEIAGELADLFKRFIFYMDMKSFWRFPYRIVELDECLLQLYAFCGTDRDTVRTKNIAKLRKRYPEKFDAEQAVNRNLDAELAALVSDQPDPEKVDALVPTHNRPCCPNCTSRAVRESSMNAGMYTCNGCGNVFKA